MIIDRENFDNNYKIFDKEIVVEIIDIFIEEYPDRIESFTKAIKTEDSELLRTTAHGFKGVLGNFFANNPYELAKKLEAKGKSADFSDVETLFKELQDYCTDLIQELETIRYDYQN